MPNRYEKELAGKKLIVYQYDASGHLLEYCKIFLKSGKSDTVQLDFYDKYGWYTDTSYSKLTDFGVLTFEQLTEMPAQELGLLIWGED